MKPWKKILAWLAAMLALGAAGVAGAAWWVSESALHRVYAIEGAPLPAPGRGALRRGEHLYNSRGCSDCHGADGSGTLMFDEAPLRVVAPNLTAGGLGGYYDLDALARAVRHGVGFDGKTLIFMPSHDWAEMSDEDVLAIAAYVKQLAPVENDLGLSEIKPLGRLLYLLGKLPVLSAEHVDHTPRERIAPPAGPTAEYGAYLALTCHGCHGADYAGQRVPGLPPDTPPAPSLRAAALAGWEEADFVRVIREGLRPDGSELHPMMPWRAFKAMTDEELRAMWLYFASLD